MRILIAAILIMVLPYPLFAQADSTIAMPNYEDELAKLEAELESEDLFGLVDSILNLDPIKPPSELNIRLGYSSNVTNGGRDFNLNQYGLSPGLSYFHSTGLFADVSGFWNSEFDPKYTMTISTIGYLGSLGSNVNYTTSFDKWFYHTDDESDISNLPNSSFNTSIEFRKSFLSLDFDYSFLFGPAQAHRFTGNLSARWQTKELIKNASFSIQPTFTLLYGNQFIITQFNGRLIDEIRSNEYLQQNLQSEEFMQFIDGLDLSQLQEQRINNIQNNRLLSDERKRSFIGLVYLSNSEVRDYIYNELETTSEEYGIMNYTFSLPVSLSFKKYIILLSYSYNIPIELPGETLELEPLGIFSSTFIYRIPFK